MLSCQTCELPKKKKKSIQKVVAKNTKGRIKIEYPKWTSLVLQIIIAKEIDGNF